MVFRALALLLFLTCEGERDVRRAAAPAPAIQIETFTGSESAGSPNAYLLLGRNEALLIDTAETRSDVARLADRIAASGRRLTTIFITHAHGDHLLGLGQLLERFPDAKVVTTPGVIDDAKQYGVGIFSNSTHRYREEGPRPLVMPAPLTGDSLQFEGTTLRVLSFENVESTHAAALYDPATRTLFAGDLVFSNAHLYLREKRLATWRAQLEKIAIDVETIYPGHGPAGDRKLFAENRRYIDDFAAALETRDPDEVRQRMLARYPRYALPRNLETSIAAFLVME